MHTDPEKQFPGMIVLVAALSLAAGAGYWLGSCPQNPQVSGEERVFFARSRGVGDADDSRLSVVDVVRESIKGTLDARAQWRQVRGLSEEEVKSAIAELGDTSLVEKFPWELTTMLFYRWGELDPVAANTAAKVMFPKGFSSPREAVITAWIKQGGGAAAWDAVKKENEIWACTRSVPGEVAEMLVASFSDLDDASAFKEVLRIDDENCEIADNLCSARARKASATPKSRTEFLAAAAKYPNDYVIYCARQTLFREWGKTDAEAALAGVTDLPIPEDERESLRSWVRREARDQQRGTSDNP